MVIIFLGRVILKIFGATISQLKNIPMITPKTNHKVDKPNLYAIPLTPSKVQADELLAE